MTQNKDQMRAEFEQWACPQADKNAIAKFEDGLYMSAKTSMAWAAWQAARASAPQGVPEGWQLVPVVPTPEMLNASRWSGSGDVSVNEEWARTEVWRRMIAAAPQPVAQKGQA